MFSSRVTVLLLICVCIWTMCITINCGKMRTFKKLSNYVKKPVDYVICRLWSDKVTTETDCARECSHRVWCRMFVYDVTNGSCSLYCDLMMEASLKLDDDLVAYAVIPETGMKGFPCTSSTQCLFDHSVCNRGICSCALGYSYSPSNNTCVKGCSKYSADFTIHDNSYLKDSNMFELSDVSFSDCWKACMSTTSCLTFAYETLGNCYVQPVTWYQVSFNQHMFHPLRVSCQRDCEI